MKTTRKLSNISYNSFEFFEAKIKEFIDIGYIDFCYFVKHLPEDDELKEHIHFVFKPSKQIDTSDFRRRLYEFDADNPNTPRTCTMKFNPCNSMDDWILYSLHDEAYLKYKGQWRKYHYKFNDIHSTDIDSLREDYNSIDRRRFMLLDFLQNAVEHNIPFYKLVQDGLIPIAQRSQYEFQYNALNRAYHNGLTLKTGRTQSHEILIRQENTLEDFDDLF